MLKNTFFIEGFTQKLLQRGYDEVYYSEEGGKHLFKAYLSQYSSFFQCDTRKGVLNFSHNPSFLDANWESGQDLYTESEMIGVLDYIC